MQSLFLSAGTLLEETVLTNLPLKYDLASLNLQGKEYSLCTTRAVRDLAGNG
jgi:hypothetical protein